MNINEKFQKIFIFFLLLLPFVIWKGAFEGPKIIYFFAGSFLIFIFWIIRILKFKKNFELGKADYFYLIWLLVLTAASLIGIHPFDSILGASYRHQGVLFFLAIWVLGKTIGILPSEGKKFLLKGVGIVVLAESLIVILQFIGGNLYLGRPLGTIGEANAAAGFLGIGAYFLSQNLITLGIIAAAVLTTFSKSGFFSLAISSLGFAKNLNKKVVMVLTLLVIVAVSVVGYRNFGEKISYLFAPTTQLWHLAEEDRVIIWRMSLDKIIERPVFGWGAEGSEVVLSSAYKKADMRLEKLIIDRSHNLILDILLWSGATGLIFFGGWFYLNFKQIKDLQRRLAFFAFLIYSLFQPLSIVHWILLTITINI